MVAPRDHSVCSGCSLCLLVCPLWRQQRNPHLTPEYLAKLVKDETEKWAVPIKASGVTVE